MNAKLFAFMLLFVLAGSASAACNSCDYSTTVVAYSACGAYSDCGYYSGYDDPYYAVNVGNCSLYEDESYNEYRYPPSIYSQESVTYSY